MNTNTNISINLNTNINRSLKGVSVCVYIYMYRYVYVCIYINSLILGTSAPSLKHQMAEICCRGEVAKFGGLTQVNWT